MCDRTNGARGAGGKAPEGRRPSGDVGVKETSDGLSNAANEGSEG
jgi:hypothetical protein